MGIYRSGREKLFNFCAGQLLAVLDEGAPSGFETIGTHDLVDILNSPACDMGLLEI